MYVYIHIHIVYGEKEWIYSKSGILIQIVKNQSSNTNF